MSALLREVVEELATLERRAGSEDEREAAERLRSRLAALGVAARVEEVPFDDGYARQLLPLGAAGAFTGLVALAGGARLPAVFAGTIAAGAIADDAANGRRHWRRLVTRPRMTSNVLAEAGDPDAERTLVVLAHHDAAPTGRVFDPSLQRTLARHFPGLIQRTHNSLPLWWPIIGGPALVALGAATGRRGVLAAGTALSLLNTLAGADIARERIVPGANDNLSGVAVLAGMAERLRAAPLRGLRVLLCSCGAEEVLQGGIYAFVDSHLRRLDPARTWVLNVDTVGSPQLVLLEGEGVIGIEDYTDPSFRDLIASTAADAGIKLVRGQRARSSTDSVIPSRAGYATATLTSFEPDTKLLSNYHLPSDTPENLDFGTIGEALDVTEALARRLAA